MLSTIVIILICMQLTQPFTHNTYSKDPNLVSMHLQKDLESIMDWVTRNGLEVNIAKTQLMILNTRGRPREGNRVKVVWKKESCLNLSQLSIKG